MTGDETNVKIICPSEEEILNYKFTATSQCPVCKKVIKNPSAMRMHMAQTHGLGTVNVLQSFNKAFNGSNKIIKSLYACPAFTCGRTYGTGRYFKALTTLREHYLCMHAEKKHVCKKCGAKFGNPKRVELHSKTCQVMFYCSCGCPFKRRDALLEHSVKNQHNLPDDIKNEILGANNGISKEESVSRNMNGLSKEPGEITVGHTACDAVPSNHLVIVPQRVASGQQIKANAYLIIANPNSVHYKGSVDINHCDTNLEPSFKIMPKQYYTNENESMDKKEREAVRVLVKSFDKSTPLNNMVASGTSFDPKGTVVNDRDLSMVLKHVTVNGSLNVDMPSKVNHGSNTELGNHFSTAAVSPSGNDNSKHDTDAEKLKRLNKALQQYKPIKKKNPSEPSVPDWQRIVPPRKYKRKRKRTEDRKLDGTPSIPRSDTSVTSMQHCLKRASNLVKSLLPTMRSPRRVTSPDVLFDELGNAQRQQDSERSVLDHHIPARRVEEISFERLTSSIARIDDNGRGPKMGTICKESASQQSLISLKDFIISSNSSRELKQLQNSEANDDDSDHHTIATEMSLENLTPELLGFLKTSMDLNVQHKSMFTASANEMSTQETQTPIKLGNNQFSFDNGYPFLCHFDNNDIETQTESFTSFLADAFTQTNQQPGKALPDKQFTNSDKAGEQFENSASWMNNNQTQTDSIHQLIADAFTQTRLGIDENETSKTGANNIADNHTQTNLSFDNFMKNFNFGTNDDTLDSNLMPDFTDMCTQTNPDPRFDSRFDELLGSISSNHNQANTANTPLNLSINSSHTQTVLSFDDMFGNSIGDDDVNMHDCREINTTYTQTSIIDDIFQTDSFTQTQFSV